MSLQEAPSLIIILVILGVVGAIGLTVIEGVGSNFTGAAANATTDIVTAIGNFFSLAPVLGTIFISVILLAAVAGLFVFAYNRNR